MGVQNENTTRKQKTPKHQTTRIENNSSQKPAANSLNKSILLTDVCCDKEEGATALRALIEGQHSIFLSNHAVDISEKTQLFLKKINQMTSSSGIAELDALLQQGRDILKLLRERK